MANFGYVALNAQKAKVSGAIEAADRRGALAALKAQGLTPLSISEQAAPKEAKGKQGGESFWKLSSGPAKRMKPAEVLLFTSELADLIEADRQDDFAFGDLGVLLGRAIRRSRLWTVPHRLGRETIRATVVGAGSYATELSGSTVYYRGVDFPLQDLPSVRLEQGDLENGETLSRAVAGQWALLDQTGPAALSLEGWSAPTFVQVSGLARALAAALEPRLGPEMPLVVVTEQDMAKALGQALGALLPRRPLLCLDGLHVPAGGYLDVAAPVGGGAAVPVVVKTLAFS